MKYIQRTSHNITHNFFRELMEDRKIIPPNNEEYYQRFLKPNKMELLDNSSLLNVDKGVQLLKSHLKKDNLILIIVDPDVDGFTSSAVMFLYLQIVNRLLELNLTIDYLLPDGKEHGLATKINELINNKKYNLVIIPDAASNDHDELKMMKDTGYDTLILDHHEFDRYDENSIVINNQGGDYENRSLSGVGVVYKFLKSMDCELDIDYADNFLDLVATGMCSDMMNLNTLENRYITDQGFKNFRNQGLREIIKAQAYSLFSKRTEEVTDSFLDSIHLTPIQVAFYIAPLINALIRVGTDKDKEILEFIKDKNAIILLNKIDLKENNLEENEEILNTGKKIIKISLVSESNLSDLYKELDIMFSLEKIVPDNEITITNIRHKKLIEDSLKHLEEARDSLEKNMPVDIISINIKEVMQSLGKITGESVSDEIIKEIFSKFCLGK